RRRLREFAGMRPSPFVIKPAATLFLYQRVPRMFATLPRRRPQPAAEARSSTVERLSPTTEFQPFAAERRHEVGEIVGDGYRGGRDLTNTQIPIDRHHRPDR